MSRLVLPFVVLLLSACAANPRIPPASDMNSHGTIRVVVKGHDGSVKPSIEPVGYYPGVYQSGAIGGAAYGLVSGIITASRREKAERLIPPIREKVSEGDLNEAFLSAFTALTVPPAGTRRFDDVSLAPRIDEDREVGRLARDGVTVVLEPLVEMSPSFDSMRVRFLVNAYAPESGQPLYRSTLDCAVSLAGTPAPEMAANIWAHGDVPLVSTHLSRCSQVLADLLVADLFREAEQLAGSSVASRRGKKRDRQGNILLGSFKGHELLEMPRRGFAVRNQVEDYPRLMFSNDQWLEVDAALLKEKIHSDEPRESRSAAKAIVRQAFFSQAVLDEVANKIWMSLDVTESYEVDAAAWLCRALGASGNGRYRELLSRVAEEAESRKLRKYAGDSVERLGDTSVEQYEIEAARERGKGDNPDAG